MIVCNTKGGEMRNKKSLEAERPRRERTLISNRLIAPYKIVPTSAIQSSDTKIVAFLS
jgi:hypothetical protein